MAPLLLVLALVLAHPAAGQSHHYLFLLAVPHNTGECKRALALQGCIVVGTHNSISQRFRAASVCAKHRHLLSSCPCRIIYLAGAGQWTQLVGAVMLLQSVSQ